VRKVFVSFHQADELEATIWMKRYGEYFREIRALGLDELGDEFAEHIKSDDSDYVMRRIREDWIAGTSCTIVLLGKCTWARRYVDWEIAATVRNFDDSPRGGLIGVHLPSAGSGRFKNPARLEMNLETANGASVGYARVYGVAPSDGTVAQWVDEAVARRDTIEPAVGSTLDLMVNNKSCE
jgi:hypothetical protein